MAKNSGKTTESSTATADCVLRCPSFFNVVRMNDMLRPEVVSGINAYISKDVSELLGANCETFGLSSRLTVGSLFPSGFRFGASYTGCTTTAFGRMPYAYIESDVSGYSTGVFQHMFGDRFRINTSGQHSEGLLKAEGTLEYGGENFNATLDSQWSTLGQRVVVLSNVVHLSKRWWMGGELAMDRVCDDVLEARASATVRYARPEDTTAVVAGNDGLSFYYHKAINRRLMTGVEMTINTKQRTVHGSWLHRIIHKNSMLKGELDTNGTIKAYFHKKLASNLKVGVGCIFNHWTNKFSLGVELYSGFRQRDE
ncbi:mitochondrial import receptor subunit TOM40 homolog 2-like [Adelges cooleyi]|uniref:mitochondrial import receptor subunit TOM40 homolog 2-like n=1 Tax=Adelges cooleyi TaxID=133065 RepID=UPI00217F8458|nr:mitochondrial import receptor subunit TOM40 homolog 2-like [Adelges cooleyi]